MSDCADRCSEVDSYPSLYEQYAVVANRVGADVSARFVAYRGRGFREAESRSARDGRFSDEGECVPGDRRCGADSLAVLFGHGLGGERVSDAGSRRILAIERVDENGCRWAAAAVADDLLDGILSPCGGIKPFFLHWTRRDGSPDRRLLGLGSLACQVSREPLAIVVSGFEAIVPESNAP